jgi:hypothetical protein
MSWNETGGTPRAGVGKPFGGGVGDALMLRKPVDFQPEATVGKDGFIKLACCS